ncbi:hypothetical protein HYN46_04245 [Aquirhabdus parva]|uniref:Uncharacterized protein n=1 Tax=Aquirhabdus parva TaxID=2283318 RepID=A0A345P4C4_9GAMM|nr:hypothetical protein HYN46_04245 [Aquirhabdus parva]
MIWPRIKNIVPKQSYDYASLHALQSSDQGNQNYPHYRSDFNQNAYSLTQQTFHVFHPLLSTSLPASIGGNFGYG